MPWYSEVSFLCVWEGGISLPHCLVLTLYPVLLLPLFPQTSKIQRLLSLRAYAGDGLSGHWERRELRIEGTWCIGGAVFISSVL